MSKERDLSEYRVHVSTEPLDQSAEVPFKVHILPVVSRHLREVVLDYNFDTFCFIDDLISKAKEGNKSLAEQYIVWTPNSLELARDYGGTNCTGLSLVLKSRLQSEGASSHLVPSYGSYLITQSADEYAGIRTTDLVGFVQKRDSKEPVFLAPGLSVDQPMVLSQGFQVESFGSRYVVTAVTARDFHILRLDRDGESRERAFHFEKVINPEESFQKNLIRARTRYQLTRQHADGERDYITFDFPRRAFRLRIAGSETTFNPGEFQNFLELNTQQIMETFNNERVITSLRTFTENIDVVVDELMLPDIQTILRQTWKSS